MNYLCIVRQTCSLLLMAVTLTASAEVQVIGGKKYECRDGVCMLVEDGKKDKEVEADERAEGAPRIAQGYMRADEFVAFLENREARSPLADAGLWLTLLLVLMGGLAMNLTPCVLPMIPINLIVIGRSAKRGAAYGLGMAAAYGVLGVGASVGGLAFGDIQGSPWFNAAVAVVFVALALALFEVWILDLSRFRSGVALSDKRLEGRFPILGRRLSALAVPFGMGALSAALAGACVAPILISVLLLTGKLYAEGQVLALGLPFVLGIGMALPWPFLGAGLRVLPKPGAWMKGVNRVFGVLVFGFAAWYGWLAWRGFDKERPIPKSGEDAASPLNVTPATLDSELLAPSSTSSRPVLVDCWASWCKNCSAMDRVLEDVKVRKALKRYTVIRMQAEDLSELRKLRGFEPIRGLPAFVVFE